MGIRVMVVDDSPIIFKTIKRALEPSGIEIVFHAENGQLCVDNYEVYKPDIVTMDITMPILDGLDASKILISKYPDVNIILMSAMDDEVVLEQAREIGIKHFSSKPVKGEELINTINKIMDK